MKLATNTGDFFDYTGSQIESMRLIKEAGFKYIDYSFGCDHGGRTGVYPKNYKKYIEDVAAEAEKLGVSLVQAHAPMKEIPALQTLPLLSKKHMKNIFTSLESAFLRHTDALRNKRRMI